MKRVLFWIIPALLVICGIILSQIRGPFYYAYYFDPDYVYLLNASVLLDFSTPAHVDHPGTTVQILAAFVILVRYLFTSTVGQTEPSPALDVIRNPEPYLYWINALFLILIAACTAVAGKIMGRVRTLHGLAFQLQVILFTTVLLALIRVTPEPLLICAALLLASALHLELYAQNGNGRAIPTRRWKIALIAGFLIGTGIATKITFAPALISILLIATWKRRFAAAAFAVAGFVLWTLPVAARYDEMFHWIGRVLAHRGTYGTGEAGIPTAQQLSVNVQLLATAEPVFFGISILLIPAGLLMIAKSRRPAVIIVALICIAQILITAKHPEPRYLIPAIVFSAWGIAILAAEMQSVRSASVLLVLATLLISAFVARSGILQWKDKTDVYNADIYRNQAELSRRNCLVVRHYRSSSPDYALSFANEHTDNYFSNQLRSLYPQTITYDFPARIFHSFGSPVNKQTIQNTLDSKRCVILTGTPQRPESPYLSDLELHPVAIRYEAIYELRAVRD